MLGIVIAMLTCLFQLIYLCVKILIIYTNGVLLCARDKQGEWRELPTKHSALAISSFSANPSHEQGAIQSIR